MLLGCNVKVWFRTALDGARCANKTMSTTDEFPLLCETCLGPNPFVRMTKLPMGGKLCQVSHLPFQAFRWKAGPAGRYKETVISGVVARERNVCQACLNDLEFGLPVGVRDAVFAKEQALQMPHSIPGLQNHYRKIANQQQLLQLSEDSASIWDQESSASVSTAAGRQLHFFAQQFHQKQSNGNAQGSSGQSFGKTAFRNLPKLCSFWLNNACTRVVRGTCPFRPCCGAFVFPEIAPKREVHSALVQRLNTEGAVAVMKALDPETRKAIHDALKGNREEAIRKRVSGEDDLAKKYIGLVQAKSNPADPPEDQSIVTLFLGNLTAAVTENEIRSVFQQYAPVNSVRIVSSGGEGQAFAFVEMFDRVSAELAAACLAQSLVLSGQPVRLSWAKPRKTSTNAVNGAGAQQVDGTADQFFLPAPAGLERAPVSTYALPGLPRAILPQVPGTRPPPPPPPPTLPCPTNAADTSSTAEADHETNAVQPNKKQRVESDAVTTTAEMSTEPQTGGLALLGEYGDDED